MLIFACAVIGSDLELLAIRAFNLDGIFRGDRRPEKVVLDGDATCNVKVVYVCPIICAALDCGLITFVDLLLSRPCTSEL